MSNLKINRIEEWLEKQPLDVAATAPLLPGSAPTTDCEASGEYTDSDSIARDTDSSEGLANSVATCLQGDQTSQEMLLTDNVYPSETSNVSNDEVESKNNSNSNPSLVKRRVNKSTAERPWSVSCISQLNTSAVEINQYGERRETHSNQRLTASFSISESALNTMSPVRPGALKQTTSSGNGSQLVVKSSDSKGSLKKRKLRVRRKNRIDESGSDESQPAQQSSTLHLLQHSLILQHQQQLLQQQQPLREIQLSAGSSSGSGGRHQHHQHQSSSHRGGGGGGLLKSESFSGRIRLSDDLVTMSSLSGSSGSRKSSSARQTTRSTAMTTMMATGAVVSTATKKSAPDSEEEHLQQQALMAKPNFKIGSVTRARCGSLNLGSLAALANYNLDGVERTEADLNGTGTGTEEMSSFSEQAWDNYQEKYMSEPYSEDRDTDAARRLLDFGDDYRNFIDSQSDCASSSLSAANMDSMSPPRFRKNDSLGKSSEPNTNSLNRRKRLDEYRMDDRYSHNMNSWSSKSGSPPHHSLDKTLTSSRGKHHVLYESPDHSPSGSSGGAPIGAGPLGGSGRRRSLRSVDKHNSFLRSLSHETSSSSNNEFDEDMEAEMKKLLIQSKLRLANTEALKAKSHLLKPEDYDEIIKTCRENVRCLETVLLSQPGTVLTAAKCQDLRGKRKPSTTKRGTHHRLKKPGGGGGTGTRTLLNRKNRQVYHFDEDQDQQNDGSEGEIDEEGHGHDPLENENSDDQNFSDNDSGVRVDDMDGQRNTVVVYECRCAKITRFVATLIEYLLDVGNLIRNFNMYRFFVGVLHGFYRLVGFFGRKPSGGDGDGGHGGDGPLRALSVGIV